MKIFYCNVCKHRVFFENAQCRHCDSTLAFLPERLDMSALETSDNAMYAAVDNDARYRLCQNQLDHAACNWAVAIADQQRYCRSCRLNVTIPDLSQPGATDAWRRLEHAKRFLLCNLMELGLPLPTTLDLEGRALRFAFMADTDKQQVFTGQSDGLITINIAEANSPFREEIREQLGETYRTLLGHFRHEIGHYYWDRLIKDTPDLRGFRAVFGDEREDYDAARQRHYEHGAPGAWSTYFVSAYASMHAWEDWAETWAHYLHMVDTLESAACHDLVVGTKSERGLKAPLLKAAALDFADFEALLRTWVPFTVALNSLNRSMGHVDAYPFVLSDRAVHKLRFVHRIVCRAELTAASVQPIRGIETAASGPSTRNVKVSSR